MKANCRDILQRLPEEDQDAINRGIEAREKGVKKLTPAARARIARAVVAEHLESLKVQRADFLEQLGEEVPEPAPQAQREAEQRDFVKEEAERQRVEHTLDVQEANKATWLNEVLPEVREAIPQLPEALRGLVADLVAMREAQSREPRGSYDTALGGTKQMGFGVEEGEVTLEAWKKTRAAAIEEGATVKATAYSKTQDVELATPAGTLHWAKRDKLGSRDAEHTVWLTTAYQERDWREFDKAWDANERAHKAESEKPEPPKPAEPTTDEGRIVADVLADDQLLAGIRGRGDWRGFERHMIARQMQGQFEDFSPFLVGWLAAERGFGLSPVPFDQATADDVANLFPASKINLFYDGVQAYAETLITPEAAPILDAEGGTDVPGSGTSLESDRGDGEPAAPVGDALQPPAGAARRDAGRADRQADLFGNEREGGEGVPDGRAAAGGKRGNQPVLRGDGRFEPTPGTPRGDDAGGSGGSGDGGIPPGAGGAEAPAEPPDRSLKAQAQLAAQSVPVKLGDIENIREALPFLTEGQQDDVAFAEQRFARENGFGALFTNSTGTGKTFTGLGIVKRFERQGKTNVLIAVPNDKIIEDWINSGKHLHLDMAALPDTQSAGEGIVVTTYANLRENRTLADRQWDMVLLDEAHYLLANEAGEATQALDALRAITMHPGGGTAWQRAKMIHRELADKLDAAKAEHAALVERGKTVDLATEIYKADDKWKALLAEFQPKVEEQRELLAKVGQNRSRVTFLSATPFPYVTSIDYAEGYLFSFDDWGKAKIEGRGYNQPDARGAFYIQHFGFRMRTGKLTKPDAAVDSGLMERNFNSWLKREKVLSGRILDVAADYDRKFILAPSALGAKVQEGFDFIRDSKKYAPLMKYVRGTFTFLARQYLLEGMKATESLSYIREQLAKGRKVVVFHDYKKNEAKHPFRFVASGQEYAYQDGKYTTVDLEQLAEEFRAERPDLVALPLDRLASPIDVFKREFGDDVLIFNGDIPKAKRRAAVKAFQNDESGKNLILVQSAAGKEGISLHDTTGKHQRALFNLGMPTAPMTAIQQEGRIYRQGQVSDAILRYFAIGTNWERWTFAGTIAQRASTAENLAMGEQARMLRQSFIDAFNEAGDYHAGDADEGKGGKVRDRATASDMDEFDRAKTYYFAQGKKTSRTKAAEGIDYFATPEPLALKMVEWADLQERDRVLEPSAGHGAIARFFPTGTMRTMIEPSEELVSKAKLNAPEVNAIHERFEDHDIHNKYEAIVMNPPFGSGGKTAMDHIEKAYRHLADGGRIVALIPKGPSMDKRLEKFLYEEDDKGRSVRPDIHLVASIDLPAVTFERAGTNVSARIVVLERQFDKNLAQRIQQVDRDYTDANSINDFFERIREASIPERQIPEWKRKLGEQSQPGGQFSRPAARNSETPASAGVSHSVIRKRLHKAFGKRAIDGLVDAGILRIVNNRFDLPAELQAQIEASGNPNVDAIYDGRETVYLLADHLEPGKIVGVMLHELGEHYGLEAMLGADEYRKLLDRVRLANLGKEPLLGEAWLRVLDLYPNLEEGSDTFIKEVIARVGESAEAMELNWFQKLIQAVRRFLTETLGMDLAVTDRDLMGLVAASLRKVLDEASAARREGAGYAREAMAHKAYHGSPHDFDRFDVSKIGTGEGAQAYGYGLYFAGKKAVAEYYKNALGARIGGHNTYNGVRLTQAKASEVRDRVRNGDMFATPVDRAFVEFFFADPNSPPPNSGTDLTKAIQKKIDSLRQEGDRLRELEQRARGDETSGRLVYSTYKADDYAAMARKYEAKAAEFDALTKAIEFVPERRTGKLYEVELAPKEDEYLDWDRPMAEQSPTVLERLKAAGHYDEPAVSQAPPEWTELLSGDFDLHRGGDMVARVTPNSWLDRSGEYHKQYSVESFVDAFDRERRTFDSLDEAKAWAESLKPASRASGESGESFYHKLGWGQAHEGVGGDRAASKILNAAGIPGIKYLDASSRSKGEGHHNYVIFDDKHVTIEAKFSRFTPTGNATLDAARKKAGLVKDRRNVLERSKDYLAQGWEGIRADLTEWRDALQQGSLDRFHSIKLLERNLNIPAEQSAYVAARLSTGVSSVMRGILMHGQPELREGIIQRKADTKGLLDVFAPVKEDFDDWVGWMVGMRARRLMRQNREHNLTKDEIAELIALGNGNEERFVAVAKEFAAFKRSILDLGEAAGLINPETRPVWDHADWIPFYRVGQDGTAGPKGRKGLSGQTSGIRTLKGGEAALNDPLENILMNFTHLIDATMKNVALDRALDIAAEEQVAERVPWEFKSELIPNDQIRKALIDGGVHQDLVDSMPEEVFTGMREMWALKPPTDPDIVRVMRDGRAQFYRVTDPLLLRALTAVHGAELEWTKPFRFFKRVLTQAVTATPDFMARNFIRDALQAWTISEDHFKIGLDSARGAWKSLREEGGMIDMMFAGGSFMGGYVNGTDPVATAAATRQALRSKGWSVSKIDEFMGTLVNPATYWQTWQELGSRIENANREAVFEAATREGKSKAQAVFEAKDLMDYSMQGEWAVFQILGDVIPFFNARLQGLYKLGRAITDDPVRVGARGLLLTAATLALLAMNDGDDRYEELEEWDKDTYWHFWIAGQHLRMPKPFEIGVIFATYPERIARAMASATADKGDGKLLVKRLWWNLAESLNLVSWPQLVAPGIEVWSNRDSFTGRPIEGLADQGKLPEARSSGSTSATMKALAATFPEASNATGMSPKRLEHLWRGYLGEIGMYVLNLSDIAARAVTNAPPRPEPRADDLPLVKAFVREDPARGTRWKTELYEMHREVEEVYRSVMAFQRDGDVERAHRLIQTQGAKLAARSMLGSATQQLAELHRERERVYRDPAMTKEAKRRRLDDLQVIENHLTETAAQAVRPAFR